jgi:hypothetical protein
MLDGFNYTGGATNISRSNITHLTMGNYLPQRDQELLYVMKIFIRLDYLSITGYTYSNISWPSAAISTPVMTYFLTFAHKRKASFISCLCYVSEDFLCQQKQLVR